MDPTKCRKSCAALQNESNHQYCAEFEQSLFEKMSEIEVQEEKEEQKRQQFVIRSSQVFKDFDLNGNKCCAMLMEIANNGDFADQVNANSLHFYKIENFKTSFSKLANCLSYLHKQGIAHNDVKFDNFFVANNKLDYRIADLEYAYNWQTQAQKTGQQQHKQYNSRNKSYLAPEVVNLLNLSRFNVDENTPAFDEFKNDIYSFGVMMFEVFTKIPFASLQNNNNLLNDLLEGRYEQMFAQIKNPEYKKRIDQHCQDSSKVLSLIAKCLDRNVQNRITLENLIQGLVNL